MTTPISFPPLPPFLPWSKVLFSRSRAIPAIYAVGFVLPGPRKSASIAVAFGFLITRSPGPPARAEFARLGWDHARSPDLEPSLRRRACVVFGVGFGVDLGHLLVRPEAERCGSIKCLLKIDKAIARDMLAPLEGEKRAVQLNHASIVVVDYPVALQPTVGIGVASVRGDVVPGGPGCNRVARELACPVVVAPRAADPIDPEPARSAVVMDCLIVDAFSGAWRTLPITASST